MNDLAPIDLDLKNVRRVDKLFVRDRSLLTIDLILLPGYSLLTAMALIEPLRLANEILGTRKFTVRLTSCDGSSPVCSNGQSISMDSVFDRDDVADFTLVCSGENVGDAIPKFLPDRLRQLWRSGKAVGALDGGVFALAQAGILSGKKFVVHWALQPVFLAKWPMLEPERDVYCIDGRILTCAGGLSH